MGVSDILSKAPDAPADTSTVSGALSALAATPNPATGTPTSATPDWRERALGFLPAAGGIAGGLIGGSAAGFPTMGLGAPEGAIAGAALGGTGGEALRQVLSRAMGLKAPETPEEAIGRMNMAGLEQGTWEAAGIPIGAGVKAIGKPLMQAILKGGGPEAAQLALEQGITASKAGLQKVMGLIGDAGKVTKGVAQRAEDQGITISGSELAKRVFDDVVPKMANRPNPQEVVKPVGEFLGNFLQAHGGDLGPTRLHAIKQAADDVAGPIYTKMASKGAPPVDEATLLRYRLHKSLADNARDMLNTSVPGYEAANGATEQLIKLKEGVFPAAKGGSTMATSIIGRSVPAAMGATLGATLHPGGFMERANAGLEGAVIGGLAANPAVLSHIAMASQNPMLLGALMQAPIGSVGGLEGLTGGTLADRLYDAQQQAREKR